MALGGGTFMVQNKVLPGAYINFISLAKASATLGDRGTVALALELDWGQTNTIVKVETADFLKHSSQYFGYDYTHDALKGLRDLFLNAKALLIYRLNGGGTKASNDFATAAYAGTRGNDIKIVIKTNVDDNSKFDVETVIDTQIIDTQTVATAAELVSSDWVDFKTGATLAVTASTPLAGGTNSAVTGANHQAFLDKLEAKSYNALGLVSTDDTTKTLYTTYIKRMREEVGTKAQLVVHNKAADYEGVVNVKNTTAEGDPMLVYWVTGVVAGTAVNKSALNKRYDGEYTINCNYTQAQLKAAIMAGEFALHQVGDDVRVLKDINSLVTTSDVKGDIFKANQTIRVIDQIATDIASLFATKYIGTVANDASGRISFWSDIVKHHEQLQNIRAIENFTSEDVAVEQGDTKDAVVVNDKVTIINAMAQLYMSVVIA